MSPCPKCGSRDIKIVEKRNWRDKRSHSKFYRAEPIVICKECGAVLKGYTKRHKRYDMRNRLPFSLSNPNFDQKLSEFVKEHSCGKFTPIILDLAERKKWLNYLNEEGYWVDNFNTLLNGGDDKYYETERSGKWGERKKILGKQKLLSFKRHLDDIKGTKRLRKAPEEYSPLTKDEIKEQAERIKNTFKELNEGVEEQKKIFQSTLRDPITVDKLKKVMKERKKEHYIPLTAIDSKPSKVNSKILRGWEEYLKTIEV